MERLEFVHETTSSDSGIYELVEPEGAVTVDPDIARLEEDLTAERERHLRLLAEFNNYRRRTKEERALAEETRKREVLLALLEVMDDFDRALLHIRERSDAVADGLRLMTVIDGNGEQSGTVYSEHRRGYLMNGKLLRPARVAVMK